ncbi:proteoglycan 4 [Eupeodes corollae]|uniref:proteoglycan 4 n=1 Tax=Eupeodes corollae TaxID=290404 RepID=UPI0024900F4E|nr:proteoglycan 4 [Eupeodes corollae]
MSDEVEIIIPEVESGGGEEIPKQKILIGNVVMEDENPNESLMDELTSIERDLAIMHEIDDDEEQPNVLQSGIVEEALAMGVASSSNDGPSEKKDSAATAEDIIEISSEKVGSERRNGTSVNSETTSDAPDSTTGSAAPAISKPEETALMHDDLLAVLKGTDTEDDVEKGVTIEGEGEFQIVDIIDSEMEFAEADPLGKETTKVEPLTKEQVHKVALEQFQSLSRVPGSRNRENNRRRKQDIKSITQPADLVTSLVSDWSDGDEANADDSEGSPSPAKKKIAITAQQAKVTLAKPTAQPSKSTTAAAKPAAAKVTIVKPAQPIKSAVPVKAAAKAPQKTVQKPEPSTDKDKAPASSTAGSALASAPAPASKKVINTAQPKKLINAEKKQPDPPPQSTFKRTRIIKRKIIWDPDAPETQFSYAKLVKPSTPAPPKKEKVAAAIPKLKDDADEVSRAGTPPIKRPASTTPSVNGGNRKKNSREIDRLLGDEGAVNMLNSLETERSKRTPDTETNSSRLSTARKTTVAAASLSPVEKPSVTPPAKKETVVAKNRKTKPKASASWDYVYKRKKQQDDDAMIIRRRSNSSYSSSASINRLSIDGPASAGKQMKAASKTTTPTASANASPAAADAPNTPETDNQFEFAKPENKSKLKKMKSPVILVNPLSADMKRAATAKRNAKSSPNAEDEADNEEAKEDVKIVNIGNVRQLTFNTHRAKLANTLTVALLNELSRVLKVLNDDTECNAVLMLSEGPNFCQGIDFTDLTVGTVENRKNAAVQLARAVKNFLMTMAKFSKPLIAGVNGANSGLGVTMLPLFDVVIGSDKGTYETPYAKIGQIPEGYFIFSETTKIRSTFKTKLLWLSEKLHSTESALSGLVNKLTSVGKVNEEALGAAKRIASLCPETYFEMKQRSIENVLPQIIESLEEEEEILVRQWCSAPCLEKFKHFIQKGQW